MSGGDPRPWVKTTIGYTEHRKIAALTDAEFRARAEIIDWCNKERTDGVIPISLCHRRWTKKVIDGLRRARILDDADDDHLAVHDYLEHNSSAEEIDQAIRKKSWAGKVRSCNRWHVERDLFDETCEVCVSRLREDRRSRKGDS